MAVLSKWLTSRQLETPAAGRPFPKWRIHAVRTQALEERDRATARVGRDGGIEPAACAGESRSRQGIAGPKWCLSERDGPTRCSPGLAPRPRRPLRHASRDGEVALHTDAPFSSRAGLPAPRRGALGVTFRGVVSMRRRRADEAGDREIAELAALADGSLAPERRVALEARVAASSELADRLAEQQRAVALTRSAGRRGRGAGGPPRAHRGAATSHAAGGHPVVSSWPVPPRPPRWSPPWRWP